MHQALAQKYRLVLNEVNPQLLLDRENTGRKALKATLTHCLSHTTLFLPTPLLVIETRDHHLAWVSYFLYHREKFHEWCKELL